MIKKKSKKYSFVGKFFHSIGSDGFIKWQGVIRAEVKKDLFMIQTFDWAMGEPLPEQILIEFHEMRNWLFYDNAESMIFSYEHGNAGKKTKRHSEEMSKLETVK